MPSSEIVKTEAKIPILGIHVAITSYHVAVTQVFKWIEKPVGRYVCISNVHMCMEAFDDSNFRSIVNKADMVVPDGRPLLWALKLLGHSKATQVRGSDFLLNICEKAQRNNVPIGFYGASQQSLTDFMKCIREKFPKLNVSFYVSPPFTAMKNEESDKYIEKINASGTRILFVGLGCPKQERWMFTYSDKLSCVMLGVGAAFDFLSGHKKQAPRWLQRAGLEWLFRLVNDPRRLLSRYLRHNPRFIYYFFFQLIRDKRDRNRSKF